MIKKEQMNIVVLGHVDHGKSTVIGRLLADTHSLPEGKLEQVQETCARNARPFEYAFLLDALKDEQAQGITIDAARCFFKTTHRDYIIIDAPGHIEFLKNMVTGAARAEAALLVIDAEEGVAENSRRHGYLASLLGITQFVVLVNKMDLLNYDGALFEDIRKQCAAFLSELGIRPVGFVPVSARNGDNIATRSPKTPWYTGMSVLEHLDVLKSSAGKEDKPFRFPLQDIYKFTADNDGRRIFAGTIEAGSIKTGDGVIFLPSQKKSRIKTIEGFHTFHRNEIGAGAAAGFTLTEEIYVRPGEIMCRENELLPHVSSQFRANIFWMGRSPMIKNRKYKLQLATSRAFVKLVEIVTVTDASDLSRSPGKSQLDRNDVAECILETTKPLAFDTLFEIEATGRFVIVDHYEIAGGGIIMESLPDADPTLRDHIRRREIFWEKGHVLAAHRQSRYHHKAKFILFTGDADMKKREIAKLLEKTLFEDNYITYYLGIENMDSGLAADVTDDQEMKEERIRRLGELARILTDSGQIFITAVSEADDYDLEILKMLNAPHEILVLNVGSNTFTSFSPDMHIGEDADVPATVSAIFDLLRKETIIPDYCI
ncbi:MAG: adenylyl-sulfate kinase [Syntrophobacterales bacterium CG_4_8_14_3_um_filter_58_8]|nr:MAG: adenylyl-sulfate kinase [Syntrophobacterales bacterium CG03_land_8_20_14_0_80_58_14]PJC75178.1 MAG: adenylyl-sulfate kinase [Syntrophobacterales bacterium CG_4_8_14_3_um_filter_58_8]